MLFTPVIEFPTLTEAFGILVTVIQEGCVDNPASAWRCRSESGVL